MSFSSHIHKNLAIPLGVGFTAGALQTLLSHLETKQFMKPQPKYRLLAVHKMFVPSLAGGILFALASISPVGDMLPSNSLTEAVGGYRMAQLAISVGLGGFSGFVAGAVLRAVRTNSLVEYHTKTFVHELEPLAGVRLK